MAEMNYYEWLGVPATTDTDEIVRILDDRYTALRTLATHPNPVVARQAEIDREVVERARVVLADPALRQAYDVAWRISRATDMTTNRERVDNTIIKQPAVALKRGLIPGFQGRYVVDQGWIAVVTEGGSYKETLQPGHHSLGRYKYNRDIKMTNVNTKLQTLAVITNGEFKIQQSVAGQMPLISDVDLSLSVEYQVADPLRVAMEIERPVTALFDRVVQATRDAVAFLSINEVRTGGASIARTIQQNLQGMLLPKTLGIEVFGVFITDIQALNPGQDALAQEAWKNFEKSYDWQVDAYMTQNSQVTWEWLLINRPDVAQMYIAQYGELAKSMIDKGMLNTSGFLTGPPGSSPAAAGSDDLTLRLDAAVPDTVALHQPFDLAVAVRREESPLLQEQELTRVRSAAVQVEWPADVTAVDLRVHVHAPDCYITGQPFQLFRLRAGQDSPVVYFSLTPQRLGDIPIRVTLFQAFLAVGSARLTAHAGEYEVGRLMTHVSSHLRPVAQSDEWTGIYTLIWRTFSLEEFETLCFEMSIDPDDLAGTTRQRKIGALVDFCRRRKLIESLAAHVLAARPNWMDLLVG